MPSIKSWTTCLAQSQVSLLGVNYLKHNINIWRRVLPSWKILASGLFALSLVLSSPLSSPAQSSSGKPVTWKDDTTRQYIKPDVWTLVVFNGQSLICPKGNAWAIHEWYLNYVRGTGGDVTKIQVRFVRDPMGVRDYTGEHSFAARLHDKDSHSWTFKSEVGVCVGVLVKHNGSKNLVLATRQFKVIPIVTG